MNKVEIRNWLTNKIADETGLTIDNINMDAPFESFNMDSLSMITISYELENVLGIETDPTLFYKFNSINLLSEAIELRTK
jgi:acyl carrier protein